MPQKKLLVRSHYMFKITLWHKTLALLIAALVQWDSDLQTLIAITSYYGPCKFSHNDCRETCNGKINHISMHLLKSHHRGRIVRRKDRYDIATVEHTTGESNDHCRRAQLRILTVVTGVIYVFTCTLSVGITSAVPTANGDERASVFQSRGNQ